MCFVCMRDLLFLQDPWMQKSPVGRKEEKKAKKENVRHFCFLQLIFEHDHDHHDFHLNDLIS